MGTRKPYFSSSSTDQNIKGLKDQCDRWTDTELQSGIQISQLCTSNCLPVHTSPLLHRHYQGRNSRAHTKPSVSSCPSWDVFQSQYFSGLKALWWGRMSHGKEGISYSFSLISPSARPPQHSIARKRLLDRTNGCVLLRDTQILWEVGAIDAALPTPKGSGGSEERMRHVQGSDWEYITKLSHYTLNTVWAFLFSFVKSFEFPTVHCSTAPDNLNTKDSSQGGKILWFSIRRFFPVKTRPFFCFGMDKWNQREGPGLTEQGWWIVRSGAEIWRKKKKGLATSERMNTQPGVNMDGTGWDAAAWNTSNRERQLHGFTYLWIVRNSMGAIRRRKGKMEEGGSRG